MQTEGADGCKFLPPGGTLEATAAISRVNIQIQQAAAKQGTVTHSIKIYIKCPLKRTII